MHAWIGYAVLALVFWGVTGVTQKLSTNRIASEQCFLWFCLAMVTLSVGIMAWSHPNLRFATPVLVCSIVGGALNGAGAWTSFRALESGGKASIVTSLVSLYPLVTIVLAVAVLRERLTTLQVLGAITAIAAAILLSIETERKPA